MLLGGSLSPSPGTTRVALPLLLFFPSLGPLFREQLFLLNDILFKNSVKLFSHGLDLMISRQSSAYPVGDLNQGVSGGINNLNLKQDFSRKFGEQADFEHFIKLIYGHPFEGPVISDNGKLAFGNRQIKLKRGPNYFGIQQSCFGDRLYVVKAENTTDIKGKSIASGIGWVMEVNNTFGLFVEHMAQTKEEVANLIRRSLTDMTLGRSEYRFTQPKMRIEEAVCENQPVCCLICAVYKLEKW